MKHLCFRQLGLFLLFISGGGLRAESEVTKLHDAPSSYYFEPSVGYEWLGPLTFNRRLPQVQPEDSGDLRDQPRSLVVNILAEKSGTSGALFTTLHGRFFQLEPLKKETSEDPAEGLPAGDVQDFSVVSAGIDVGWTFGTRIKPPSWNAHLAMGVDYGAVRFNRLSLTQEESKAQQQAFALVLRPSLSRSWSFLPQVVTSCFVTLPLFEHRLRQHSGPDGAALSDRLGLKMHAAIGASVGVGI